MEQRLQELTKKIQDTAYPDFCINLVNYLEAKTNNLGSRIYFQNMFIYLISKVASMMRINIKNITGDQLPINAYVINLLPSGGGKGVSMGIVDSIFNSFKNEFILQSKSQIADNIMDLAQDRAGLTGEDVSVVAQRMKDYVTVNSGMYEFSEGTVPALKQCRAALQIQGLGSLNYICDEIGSNLTADGSKELLTHFLEVYDKGLTRGKLTKNSKDFQRTEEYGVPVPYNMVLFGTPTALLDSGPVESLFMKYLRTGFARRCFFGYGTHDYQISTVEDEFNKIKAIDLKLGEFQDLVRGLCDATWFNKVIELPDNVAKELINYKQICEFRSSKMLSEQDTEQSEMTNRFFKTLKLAGALAFLDHRDHVTLNDLYQAIKFSEDSGTCFKKIVNQPANYAKLAMYLAEVNEPKTDTDIMEKLPFYRKQNERDEIYLRAVEWGYYRGISIRRYRSSKNKLIYTCAEKYQQTDLTHLIISMSKHDAYNYQNKFMSFTDLPNLGKINGFNWVNHHLLPDADPNIGNHRDGNHIQTGFNMIVLDVDHGSKIKFVRDILKKYYYVIYTTKRYTDDNQRFRVIIPIKYTLNLKEDIYKEFMKNVSNTLPFEVDMQTFQRSRKWSTNKGLTFINNSDELELFDPLGYIPDSNINEGSAKGFKADLNKLENWFIRNTDVGDRNNMLYRYGRVLIDNGVSGDDLEAKIVELNSKLVDPLTDAELESTVLKSLLRPQK